MFVRADKNYLYFRGLKLQLDNWARFIVIGQVIK